MFEKKRLLVGGRLRGRRGVLAMVTAGVLAMGVLAGCGSSSSNSSASTSSSATTSAAASASGTSSASSSTSQASTGGPFNILFLGDLTGQTKFLGVQDLTGLKAAAAYWNAHGGGIAGHHIVVNTVSDNGDPTTAVSVLLQYLSSHPKPNWVYAGSESNEINALIPVLKREKLMGASLNDSTGLCGTNAQTVCPTTFWVGSQPIDQTKAAANYFKSKGFKKVGILAESLAYTQAESTQLVKSLAAVGIQSVLTTFPPTQVSVTPEVSDLKSKGVDSLFVAALGPAVGYALHARAALGWNVPIVFDLAASSSDITTLAPAAQIKNTFEEIFRSNNTSLHLPGATALVTYAKAFGGITKGDALDTLAFPWDDLVALHAAGQQAGSDSQTALVAAENNLNAAGQSDPLYLLDPHVKWTPSDHDTIGASPADYYFVPVGPLHDGQVG